MRRKIHAVLLIAIVLCIQGTDLVKAETVYKESMILNVGIYTTMKCSFFMEFNVTTPDSPFDASEFTGDPEFNSFYIFCHNENGIAREIGYVTPGDPSYNVSFRTDVQVYMNGTGFTPTLHGLRVADALKSKVEDMFSIILLYVSKRTSSMGIPHTDFYSFLSNVSVIDQFWDIFKMQNFHGFSELFTSNANIHVHYMELRLEKIDGSYMWTYNFFLGFDISRTPIIEFGQEYMLSLNEMLGRSGDIESALGSSASNINVDFNIGNATWTFIPLGIEPIMVKTQDDPQAIVFSTDIADTRVTDVKIRFKVLEKPENYLAMYVGIVALGAIACTVGSYLFKRRKNRSSRYGW